ncbi:CobD/CbiB family cobalamin biosynthesis protein [Haloparvum sedimenti]|uniref:CobD/CbiB family cobalamin biosynthesis protein n=1 Tax=Haloparvum sedimenti TaxID=1678448 RepID=UPI00071E76CD|nr:CobD/CbiB family cobalamin biosynthesis protein [Haloparvum sedimenti]
MPAAAAAAVALAVVLDRLFAEPPARLHPVVWLGKIVGAVDRRFRSSALAGLLAAAVLPLAFAGAAAGTVWGGAVLVAAVVSGTSAVPVLPAFSALPAATAVAGLLAGLVLFSCSSLRMLLDAASEVVSLSVSDLDAARNALPSLAGRDPSALSAADVRSTAVESAAENLADGLVAPLAAFAFAAAGASLLGASTPFLALPLAAGATAWVKGVNTLDSMLGYRSKPVGRAPARLDDAVMWLPARASALCLGLAVRSPGAVVRAREWARIPASPNSGWPMATAAAALDVRLRKPDAYDLNPDRELPDAETAAAGVRLVGRAGWTAVAIAGVTAAV